MFNILARLNIKYVVLASILASSSYYVYGLKSKIHSQKKSIHKYKTKVKELESKITLAKVQEKMYLDKIAITNRSIKKMEDKAKASEIKWKEWKAKPEKIRYKEVYTLIPGDVDMIGKDECQRMLETNKGISRINYEDL